MQGYVSPVPSPIMNGLTARSITRAAPASAREGGETMTGFICATCGTQFPPSDAPPAHCPICEDERQYIGWGGQRWTTMAELRAERRAEIKEEEPGLTGIGTTPSFAIG